MAVDTQSDPSLAHRQNAQFIHGSVEVPKCWSRRKMRGLGWVPLFNLNYESGFTVENFPMFFLVLWDDPECGCIGEIGPRCVTQ